MDIEKLKEVLGNEFAFIYNDINPVIQDLKLNNQAKILDIGTGMGNMAITLALNDYTVITGEPEDDESKYAKQNWLESSKKAIVEHLITYTPFNAEKMPFEDSSFDAVFLLGTLHHIDNKELTLKECKRIIKLGGIICISEPNREALIFIRENKFSDHPDSVDPRKYAHDLHLSAELIKRPFYDTFILKNI
jgi:ubiquinone/menaquinone biosynthesis C-methylase UbiE